MSIVYSSGGVSYISDYGEPVRITRNLNSYLPITVKTIKTDNISKKLLDSLVSLDPKLGLLMRQNPILLGLLDAGNDKTTRGQIVADFIKLNPYLSSNDKNKLASLVEYVNFNQVLGRSGNLTKDFSAELDKLKEVLGPDIYDRLLDNNLITTDVKGLITNVLGTTDVNRLKAERIDPNLVAGLLASVLPRNDISAITKIVYESYGLNPATGKPAPELVVEPETLGAPIVSGTTPAGATSAPVGTTPDVVVKSPFVESTENLNKILDEKDKQIKELESQIEKTDDENEKLKLQAQIDQLLEIGGSTLDATRKRERDAPKQNGSSTLEKSENDLIADRARAEPQSSNDVLPLSTGQLRLLDDIVDDDVMGVAGPLGGAGRQIDVRNPEGKPFKLSDSGSGSRPMSPRRPNILSDQDKSPSKSKSAKATDVVSRSVDVSMVPTLDNPFPDMADDGPIVATAPGLDKVDATPPLVLIPPRNKPKIVVIPKTPPPTGQQPSPSSTPETSEREGQQTLSTGDQPALSKSAKKRIRLRRRGSNIPSEGSGSGITLERRGYRYRTETDEKEFKHLMDSMETETGKTILEDIYQLDEFPKNVMGHVIYRQLTPKTVHKDLREDAMKESPVKLANDFKMLRNYIMDRKKI